jgi:hypothetical protein
MALSVRQGPAGKATLAVTAECQLATPVLAVAAVQVVPVHLPRPTAVVATAVPVSQTALLARRFRMPVAAAAAWTPEMQTALVG